MESPLVRGAFALLAVATAAAFFVTQQLKGQSPLVHQFAARPAVFSPNGDGVRDRSIVGFDLSETAEVSLSIVDADGNEVRRLFSDQRVGGDRRRRLVWDGRDDARQRVPDGLYRLRLVRPAEGRVINSIRELRVDTRPPRARLLSARPGVFAPRGRRSPAAVRIVYRGPRNRAPDFRVFRTDRGTPRLVARFAGDRTRSGVWSGRVGGRPAPDGDYAFTVTVRDRAGNAATAPASVPSARSARPGTGVVVRRLELRGPLSVVPAGSHARFQVGPLKRRFRFVLSRLGSRRALRRGRRSADRLELRMPRRARTGVYLVRVRARGRRAVWPVAVAGLPPSRRAARRPRPLVVLPAISWQGLNRVDGDRDGFADTLENARSVGLRRPFAGGRLPAGFSAQSSPLLRFLERRRLAYDLTTDVSLAVREGPALANAPGVAFAGSARWLTPALLRRLRRYAVAGGRVASFGADALRRRVRLGHDVLHGPSGPSRRNAFGEQTALLRTTAAPLAVFDDRLGVFRGVDRFLGQFSVFERSLRLPAGAPLAAAAGRDPGEPAFVAYRLGRGLVIRSGTPEWGRELSERRLGVEVPRVTERLWQLLAGD